MSDERTIAKEGVIAGLAAYLMWGFLPVYFKTVSSVDPLEVLADRIIWAIPCGCRLLLCLSA